jgi:hypothetical protein
MTVPLSRNGSRSQQDEPELVKAPSSRFAWKPPPRGRRGYGRAILALPVKNTVQIAAERGNLRGSLRTTQS